MRNQVYWTAPLSESRFSKAKGLNLRPFDPRLSKYARSSTRYLLSSVFIGILLTLIIIQFSFKLAYLITTAFQQGGNIQNLGQSLFFLLALILARSFLIWLNEVLAIRSASVAKSQLRNAVMKHAQRLGPVQIAKFKPSQLTNTINAGIDGLDAYFSRYLPQLGLVIVVPILVGFVILKNDLLSGIIILLTLPIIPIFMVLVGWYTNKENEKQWYALQKLTNYMNDIFYGFSTLAIFKRLHKQDKTLQSASNQYRLSLLKVLRISFLSAFVLEIAATLSVALIAVSIGIRLVNGNIELGSGLLILILAPEVYLPLRALGANYHAAAEGLGATNQIFEFLETETAIKSNSQKIRNIESMEVTDLSVKFDEITAINNLNFSAHPGEITALVGPSGSGKTTLINCLLGFVFTEKGNISIVSDEKKFNITEIDIEDLRKNVSLLSQFPLLFPGTVNFNVALADPTKRKEEIDEVLNKVGIGYLSKQLINSNGEGVSTGEKRRIGLARVILNPKPIILLDEPTASLDEISEKIVLEHIKRLANKSIVIAATHHDALIEISGKIIEISTERSSPLDGLRI